MISFFNYFKRQVWLKVAALAFLCLLLTAAFRLVLLQHDLQELKKQTKVDFAPFQVESAIMYNYVNQAANHQNLNQPDHRLGNTSDYTVAQQMSVGLEYFLGYAVALRRELTDFDFTLNRDYEFNSEESDFIRTLFCLWGCLTPVMLFFWLLALRCPLPFAFLGGMINAVTPAAIARYSGQELLREPFAMPLIILSLTLLNVSKRKTNPILFILLTAVTMGAVSFWDGAQIIFAVWGIIELIKIIYSQDSNRSGCLSFLAMELGMILSALFVPFNATHGLLFSPTVMMIYPLLIIFYGIEPIFNRYVRFRNAVFLFGAFIIAYYFLHKLSIFNTNYSHFQTLLEAKLTFLNQKPQDPGLLNFDQRYLWTPELHSADYLTTVVFFPFLFALQYVLFFVGLCFKNFRQNLRENWSIYYPFLLLSTLFFGVYIFFVRFHVHCGIFLAMSLPICVWMWYKNAPGLRRFFIVTLVICGILYEASVMLWGNILFYLPGVDTFYPRLRTVKRQFSEDAAYNAQLVKYLRKYNLEGQVFAANIDCSSLLLGYTNATIIIQPQYELPRIRNLTQDYFEKIFNENENVFAQWCAQNNINYIIFARGMMAEKPDIYTPRYMAAAVKPNPSSAAFLMEYNPEKLKFFHEITIDAAENNLSERYRIFRFCDGQTISKALDAAALAIEYQYNNKQLKAQALARAAYFNAPQYEETAVAYFKIFKTIPDPLTLDKYVHQWPPPELPMPAK